MSCTVPSIKPNQLSRTAPLEWTASAYVAIKGGFKIPWFHRVTLCPWVLYIQSVTWLQIKLSSSSDRPKIGIMSEQRHGYANRFRTIQRASVPSQIVPWEHLKMSGTLKASISSAISLLSTRKSALRSAEFLFSREKFSHAECWNGRFCGAYAS